MIYVSSPYTSDDTKVVWERFNAAKDFVAWLLCNNKAAISIPVHFHPLVVSNMVPTAPEFWNEYFPQILKCATSVYVLMLDGWRQSNGVYTEVKMAGELGIPVTFFVPMGKEYESVTPHNMFNLANIVKTDH